MNNEIILVVDDMEVNRALLCGMFQNNYKMMEAGDGEEALKIVEEYKSSIVTILLDIIMPNMDGFEVLKILNQKKLISRIPVILITGDTSAEAEKKAYEVGVADMIAKPFNPHIIQRRVQNTIDLYNYKNKLERMVSEQTRVLQSQSKKLKEMNSKIIDIMSTIVEFRNMESGKHIKRIKGFTNILAKVVAQYYPEYGLTEEQINIITEVSAMHDIGKIVIPDSVLLKPAKWTEDEFELMESHTTKGCEIIAAVAEMQDAQYQKYGYEICRYHHERFDGNGYPDGLKGDEIPVSAQIVSIADAYEALIHERRYKSAYSKSKAFIMIQEGERGIFSPKMLEALKIARDDFECLADANEDKE
ncbi:MAG: response regulator [Lachnospiraceae bacterium]|nr:response regulator [Lachnospiraceae bacterium]